MEYDIKKQVKESGLLQSEDLHKYLLETSVYPREAAALKELREATENHPKSFMAGSPLAGQMIAFLLKKENARKTIEVGVFTGYSLLLTALSIPDDGKITAIDYDREAYEIGLPFIRKAGIEEKINFVESDALLALDNLLQNAENEGSFDFAFVDADKTSYQNYHERLMKLIKVGGVIAYDNTLWGGTVAMPESQVPDFMMANREAVIKLNKSLAADTRIDIAQLPLAVQKNVHEDDIMTFWRPPASGFVKINCESMTQAWATACFRIVIKDEGGDVLMAASHQLRARLQLFNMP